MAATTINASVNEPDLGLLSEKQPREGYDKITCRAAFSILGGWCVLLIIGAQLAWGNQSTYIASYYYMLGYPVHMNDFYIVQPLIVSIATVFFPLGMKTAERIGARKVLICGGVISLSMVYACSYIKSPNAFIYCYSAAFGLGKALMYSSVLQAAWTHLRGRIGLVSGLIICGFGFGGFIFGLVSNQLCNPDNISVQTFMIEGVEEKLFPTDVAERVPYMLRTLDIIWSCLFIFGACSISTYELTDETNEASDHLLDSEQRATVQADDMNLMSVEERERQVQEKEAEENIPMIKLLCTGKFLWLYLLVVCHMFYGYYMSNQFKQYGFTGGLDDRTLTRIGSAGALFNGCFKILWAGLLDYFNFKPIYSIVLLIQISCLIAVHWAVYNGGTYFIVICLSFMCDGSMTSMIPVVTNNIFGLKRGPMVYSYIFSTFGVAAMLGTLFVKTCQTALGYHVMLIICLGFTMTAGLITIFYRFDRISYAELAAKVGWNSAETAATHPQPLNEKEN